MNIRIVRSSGNGTDKIVWGCILAVLFGLAAVWCATTENKDDMVGSMVICAGIAVFGIYLLVQGVRIKRRAKSIPEITHEFDVDAPDFVKERLNELMFEGNPGATSVSKTVRRVTYTRSDGTTHTTETVTESTNAVQKPRGYHAGAVTCQACGGINQLKRGQHGVCEYCGSHIEG